MGFIIKRKWLLALLAAGGFCASLHAEVVYQDNFERNFVDADGVPQTVETIPYWPRRASTLDPNIDWYTTYTNLSFRKTDVTAGEGLLTIHTEDINSGVLSHTSDNYDFFNQELTYTFDGVSIQALGQSRIASQWVKFGVVANSDRNLWKSYPLFLIAVSGSGAFSLQIWQGSDRAPRKEFKSNIFNFDVTLLRKVELTMDATNFRILFNFENPLDVLSFGGPHNLDRNSWYVDTVGVNFAKRQMDDALKTLTTWEGLLAEAQASGVQADIDAAQAQVNTWQDRYDAAVVNYDAKLLLAEGAIGDSALMLSVTSDVNDIVNAMSPAQKAVFDADYAAGLTEIGARVTVNSITVETTNILQ